MRARRIVCYLAVSGLLVLAFLAGVFAAPTLDHLLHGPETWMRATDDILVPDDGRDLGGVKRGTLLRVRKAHFTYWIDATMVIHAVAPPLEPVSEDERKSLERRLFSGGSVSVQSPNGCSEEEHGTP